MPRIDQYRDVPSLAPTVLVARGEDVASLVAKSAAARHAADSQQDQRSAPTGVVAGS